MARDPMIAASRPIRKLLVANRGEIAARIMATARRLGIATVAVYSDADADALHVASADEAVRLGPAPVAESYLRADAILAAARATGADAVHPGYGFLSENPDFAAAVAAAGLVWVGPPAAAIRAMGLKDAAKRLMEEAGVPVVPGHHGAEQEPDFLAAAAERIGYPVLIKARAGGGGKGMRRVARAAEFAEALASARGEARASFGDDAVLIEKYVATPRHIEIQVFADTHGGAVHLFERDCSLQRRHQKVIEEAPAPGMPPEMRAAMGEAAVRAAQAVGYVGAGTVEFIVDASDGLRADRFYFMEMNTRLQVEHPVTEAITGLDLVEWQLRIAAGEPLPRRQDELAIDGWAFEARVYAEDPAKGFLPQTGRLTTLELPADRARIDAGVREGDRVTPFYDPMIAKVIVHGPSRAAALAKLRAALAASRIAGCATNLAFLHALTEHPDFAAGRVDTGLIERDLARLTAAAAPPPEAIAAAALAALGLVAPPPAGARDPFAALVGWRAWGVARLAVDLTFGDRALPARLSIDRAGRITLEAREGQEAQEMQAAPAGVGDPPFGPFRAEPSAGGLRLRLEDGRILSLGIAAEPGAVAVQREGRSWRFAVVDPLERIADRHAGGGDRVTAPMPGLVKAVHVAVGDRVAAGQTLAVMEAMKMEHRLTAPRDGAVDEITAAPGDQVEDGALILALAPEAPE